MLKKLGFSTFLSRSPSPLITTRVLVSGLHLKNPFGSIFSSFPRRDFVVRAESSPEGEVEVDGTNGEGAEAKLEVGEGADAEAGLEGEVKNEEKAMEPRNPRIKLGEVMGILNRQAIEASQIARPIPDLRTGDIVEIKFEVLENRRRLSIYKGIVMSKQNAGIHTTIRIRRIIAGIGVEIVFPIYSPNIKEIRVVSYRKVRKARQNHLRDKLPRLCTFK